MGTNSKNEFRKYEKENMKSNRGTGKKKLRRKKHHKYKQRK